MSQWLVRNTKLVPISMPKFGDIFTYSRVKIDDTLIIFDGLDELDLRYAVFDMHFATLRVYNYEEKVVYKSSFSKDGPPSTGSSV
jgi:hypothetical protein